VACHSQQNRSDSDWRRFSSVGEIPDAEFMVVTQRKSFNGYLGMDASLIPQFEEGVREVHVRKLLEAEGVIDIEFATRLD